MTDDLVKRLRAVDPEGMPLNAEMDSHEAATRIEALKDIIARIQYTNLRRDMNLKNRTMEIDKLCKREK